MSELSTELEPDSTTTAGGGAVSVSEPKPESHSDSLRAVMKEADARTEVKAEPAKEEVKDEKPVAPAPEKADKAAPDTVQPSGRDATRGAVSTSSSETAPSDGEKRHEAPARFSEQAKAVWRNAPREVQSEVARWERESEDAKPRLERYESLREFDELAKSSGRDLKDSLIKINQFENMMKSNPIGALNSILQEIGPRKADGSTISLMEVAQHIVNQGQDGYQRTIQQASQQQQQQQQEMAAKAQQQEQAQMNQHLVRMAFVEPFRAANPRYDELEGHIALFLQSDMVDKSLSPAERLAQAYSLAERVNPVSGGSPSPQPALDPVRRADPDFSGSKSIKTSPGLVADEDMEDRAKPGESIMESIQAEARRLKRA